MQNKQNAYQEQAAKKQFEWLNCSMPQPIAQAADSAGKTPEGIALPPHERNCGKAHPIKGTNSEDLAEWCREHET